MSWAMGGRSRTAWSWRPGRRFGSRPPGAPLVDFDPDAIPLGAITSMANRGAGGSTYDLTSGGATVVSTGPAGHRALEFAGSQRLMAATVAPWRWLHAADAHVLALVRAPSANPDALVPICGTNGGTTSLVGMSLWVDDRSSLSRDEQVRHLMALSSGSIGATSPSGAITPLDQWHLVESVLSVDGTVESTLYVDGEKVAFGSSATPVNDADPDNPLSVGDLGLGNYLAPAGARLGRLLMYDSLDAVDAARAWMLAYAGLS